MIRSLLSWLPKSDTQEHQDEPTASDAMTEDQRSTAPLYQPATSALQTDGGEHQFFDRIEDYPYTHYTDAIGDAKQLTYRDQYEEAEALLLWCIEFVEAESTVKRYRELPKAYYRRLATIYRTQDRHMDEIALIDRYMAATDEIGGTADAELINRLETAQEMSQND
ncbi:hypothetical protein HUB97_07620 [Halorubraceae archaeon YAN]|nr:hypothetical protein [Halorubraceae archaeon YAN]